MLGEHTIDHSNLIRMEQTELETLSAFVKVCSMLLLVPLYMSQTLHLAVSELVVLYSN